MTYFFVLGSHPSLSLAEITAYFGSTATVEPLNQNIVLLHPETSVEAADVLAHLGGAIKIGAIQGQTKQLDVLGQQLQNSLADFKPNWQPKAGKIKFGFSSYGLKPSQQKTLAMDFKKYLRSLQLSCRWVISREETLSSVVVEQNKLTGDLGLEIVIIKNKEQWLWGQTLAVQPFKELSRRDYGRPARDDQSGMLPPKLAQIMINLSQIKPHQVLLDPFCGSGTVLSEGLLWGLHQVLGSDLSSKAIKDSQTNLAWIIKHYALANRDFQLYCHNVESLSEVIKDKVAAIVTEPYLGPQRGRVDIRKTKGELSRLYARALQEFSKVLKPGGRVVMIWPVFVKTGRSLDYLEVSLADFKIIDLTTPRWPGRTFRQTLLYGRPGQKVWREVVVLEKKK